MEKRGGKRANAGAKKKHDGEKKLPEIRITGVSESIRDEAINIARNQHASLSDLLKPVVREWVEKHSDDLRRRRHKD